MSTKPSYFKIQKSDDTWGMTFHSRHDVTDRQWAIIEPLLPVQPAGPGRKRNEPRQTLNGILWMLHTGSAWADLPAVYGSDSTCWRWLQQWTADGTWDLIWHALLSELDVQQDLQW